MHPGSKILNEPVCFQFMPKTVTGNVFIMQVCWKAAPNMWPGSRKALPNVWCVRGTAHSLSVNERSRRLGPSQTKCIRCQPRTEVPGLTKARKRNASLKSTHIWTDAGLARCGPLISSSSSEKPSGGILDGRNFADEALRQAVEQ